MCAIIWLRIRKLRQGRSESVLETRKPGQDVNVRVHFFLILSYKTPELRQGRSKSKLENLDKMSTWERSLLPYPKFLSFEFNVSLNVRVPFFQVLSSELNKGTHSYGCLQTLVAFNHQTKLMSNFKMWGLNWCQIFFQG